MTVSPDRIHEENGVFGVSFPDFPGCATTASDMRSAIERGAQALALHVKAEIDETARRFPNRARPSVCAPMSRNGWTARFWR